MLFCFLAFIFPVIMSALQYLMTPHLFTQFQVAPLSGEGLMGGVEVREHFFYVTDTNPLGKRNGTHL